MTGRGMVLGIWLALLGLAFLLIGYFGSEHSADAGREVALGAPRPATPTTVPEEAKSPWWDELPTPQPWPSAVGQPTQDIDATPDPAKEEME